METKRWFRFSADSINQGVNNDSALQIGIGAFGLGVNTTSVARSQGKGLSNALPTQVTGRTGKVADAADDTSLPVLQNWCFAPDTLIQTPTGSKRIDGLHVGDDVLAFDFENDTWVVRPVIEQHISRYKGAIVKIRTEGGEVVATAYHPFWVVDGYDLLRLAETQFLCIILAAAQMKFLPQKLEWANSTLVRTTK